MKGYLRQRRRGTQHNFSGEASKGLGFGAVSRLCEAQMMLLRRSQAFACWHWSGLRCWVAVPPGGVDGSRVTQISCTQLKYDHFKQATSQQEWKVNIRAWTRLADRLADPGRFRPVDGQHVTATLCEQQQHGTVWKPHGSGICILSVVKSAVPCTYATGLGLEGMPCHAHFTHLLVGGHSLTWTSEAEVHGPADWNTLDSGHTACDIHRVTSWPVMHGTELCELLVGGGGPSILTAPPVLDQSTLTWAAFEFVQRGWDV